MRVLIAEDDDHLRGTLSRGLAEEGYVVESFARGDDALSAGLGGNFDLRGSRGRSATGYESAVKEATNGPAAPGWVWP